MRELTINSARLPKNAKLPESLILLEDVKLLPNSKVGFFARLFNSKSLEFIDYNIKVLDKVLRLEDDDDHVDKFDDDAKFFDAIRLETPSYIEIANNLKKDLKNPFNWISNQTFQLCVTENGLKKSNQNQQRLDIVNELCDPIINHLSKINFEDVKLNEGLNEIINKLKKKKSAYIGDTIRRE